MSLPRRMPQGAGHQLYSQPKPRPTITWTEGDIAFLIPYSARQSEYGALPVRVPVKATCHPVIILKACSTGSHYVVTTISAYGVSPDGGPAPWAQHAHRYKTAHDFRVFTGTEPYVDASGRHESRAPLTLEPGMRMPKPKTSWVYARTAFLVPASVLGVFNKSPTQLRMTKASLNDLRAHMAQCSSGKSGYRGSVDVNGRVNCACCCGGSPPQQPPVVPVLGLVSPALAAAAGGCGVKSAPGPIRPMPPANAPAGPRSWRPPPAAVPVVSAPTTVVQAPKSWAAIAARA
ncbi:hypothetical protein MCOR14_001957 [Pyricularia oryzae]|uniref:Uncharacterized protein n=1 Tax=Pyricularia oryzae TaxID=318829 RepID=A0A4P7NLM5_PYROR|nr:hypothetical protein MCOR13_002527 [Pyricularia oryzae]KAI6643628.1 hypothetical protein MCOR14_001957 [Pyricularia oryzae]QBZ63083.1 hypothetical protein PoMZ_11976 [Pyricularia oryzae]